jgi:hypothetical protein
MPAKHPEADAKNIMCGSCQWFLAGFNGKNCQTVRGVKYNTAACKEFTLPLSDPYFHIIQDKYIQGIREVLASSKFKIDASILEELRSYIIDDDFTKFRFGTVQDLEAMNLSLKKIIQLRSRVSTIYTSMMDIKHEYEELQYHCQLWLVSKYEIIRDLKSEGLRKVVTLRLLPEMINISKNIDKNIIVAKHIDDRLESNERTLSKILSSSEKLWFSRERVGGVLKGVFND